LHARSEWFVAADILLMHRTAGLVGNILRDLQITASVVVCDAAPACESGQRGGGYAGSILGGTRDLSEPPHPTYGLMEPGPDSTVFVRGPSPSLDVAFHRYVVNSEYVMGPIPLVSLPTTAERMTYVAAAAPQLRIPILESPSLKIVYLTESAVEGTVERFRQNIVQSYMSMIS
jgi:hypothetical protein